MVEECPKPPESGEPTTRQPGIYGPSPPFAVHDRGSHFASGSTVVVGGWNLPLLVDAEADVVVVVLDDPAPVPLPAPVVPTAEVGVTAAGGGLTLNWVPVTTVTWDPGCTCDESSAMITAPLIEFATAWAAARLARDFDE
jgi:hypothetical protein